MLSLKEKRQILIGEYIRTNGQASMKELPSIFKVSMNTIRADIDELAKSGVIKKVYGGVIYNNPDSFNFQPIPSRLDENYKIKRTLCKLAASLIEDGDQIYIDYGTTTRWIPDFLNEKNNVQVVTPNFYAITKMAMDPEANFIMLPGRFDYSVAGVMSEATIQDIKNYHFSKVFMACTGIDFSLNVSSASYIQREIKHDVISNADKCYLMVDSSKFSVSGNLFYGNLSSFEAVITDSGISTYKKALLHEKNITCLIAEA